MTDITYAVINLSALKYNLAVLKKRAPNSQVLAVIKANAYGHGMVKISQSLKGLYAVGVARISEALRLRDAGVETDILLLEGFFYEQNLPLLSENNLQTVVHSVEQMQAILDADLSYPLKIWLKLDIGMHRLGFHPEEFETVYEKLTQSKNVQQPINIIGHFNCADELKNPVTKDQIALFERFKQKVAGKASLANSAGTLAWDAAHYDVIRPGIALYGVSPFVDEQSECAFEALRPVMTLKSQLIAVRTHKKGESVGYGANWASENDTILGVVAMGYGDGYPRTAPAGTPVLVNGRIIPIVGRVSMDMLCVDLGLNAQDKVGDDVTLWGEGLPANQVAEHIGTIGYELITKLTSRVALKYVE